MRSIIEQFEVAEHAMTQHKGVSGGRLNVAAISAGDYFLPRLLVEFIGRHQGVTLNFTVHNREGLLAHLAANLTDLAIMARPPADAEMVSEPFAPHPYVIVAAPSHPLAGRRGSRCGASCASPSSCARRAPTPGRACRRRSAPHLDALQVALEITSTETLKQAVMAGLGIGFLSAHTVAQELRTQSLVVLDVRGFPRVQRWYVVHRRHKRLPPVAQAFRQFLRDEGAGLLARIMDRRRRAHRLAAERAVDQGLPRDQFLDFDRRRQRPQQQSAGRDLQLELAGPVTGTKVAEPYSASKKSRERQPPAERDEVDAAPACRSRTGARRRVLLLERAVAAGDAVEPVRRVQARACSRAAST